MISDHENLENTLEREARLFASRSHNDDIGANATRRVVVADFEYKWDRDRHSAYQSAEGRAAERSTRWPFHRVAAASWMILRFDPGQDVPTVEDMAVLASDETNEIETVERFFAALDQHPDANLVTWGGEAKDLAVLRRSAGEFGLVLPHQLIDGSPHARGRLDLCRAVAVQAASVHLPEYAAATSIPAKPSQSKDIGMLVERGTWGLVREQVMADVLTTTVIALRHLSSHGVVMIDREKAVMAIAEAAARYLPGSAFVAKTFKPWARDRLRAKSLRGVVYRDA